MTMGEEWTLIVSGNQFRLNNLDESLNESFKELYTAWFGRGSINCNKFKESAKCFFDQNPDIYQKHNKYFENFVFIWQFLSNQGKYAEAQKLWEFSLEPVLEWEQQNKSNRIHKGTAYYFFGVTALLQGESDKGYSLMHQALEEDKKNDPKTLKQFPAYSFVTLNYKQIKQFFRSWLLDQINFLNENFLIKYKRKYESKLDLESFRVNYLEKIPDISLLYLFSYTLNRFYMFHNIREYALQSPFASQLELNLLFDIALVIDNSVNIKNPKNGTFIVHASFLSNTCRLGMNEEKLGTLNGMQRDNFDGTLEDLLNNNCTIDSYRIEGREKDLSITYCIRNHAAHNSSFSEVVWKRFSEIETSVFNTLFWVVDDLYS